jgi:glutamate 5-kinase
MNNLINQFKGIVIKVGSKAITTDHTINSAAIENIARATYSLRELGKEVSVVTSGAIAAGRRRLNSWGEASLPDKQMYAAVGQPLLMQEYINVFSAYGLNVAQFLVSKEDFDSRISTLINSYNTAILKGVIPVFNENDSVAVDEIRFTDNDELQGLIAERLYSELLVNLTLYDGLIKDGKVVEVPTNYNEGDYDVICSERKEGRGGLQGKLDMISKMNSKGKTVIIGNVNGDIVKMIEGSQIHSRFMPFVE